MLPYPIRDMTVTCENCSTSVYPREILSCIPQYIFILFFIFALAFHFGFEMEWQSHFKTFEIFTILFSILLFTKFLDIQIFDLAIEKNYDEKIQRKKTAIQEKQGEKNHLHRIAYIVTLLWCGILFLYLDFMPYYDWLGRVFENVDHVDGVFMISLMLIAIIPYVLIIILSKARSVFTCTIKNDS